MSINLITPPLNLKLGLQINESRKFEVFTRREKALNASK